ncbi:hypothetical protein E4U51_006238 [Claviceps purpurea]|nr:hypothetical protein E4U51_006238 [Claviceps purpurea]
MLSKSKPARYQKYPSKVAGVHLLNTTANVFVFPYDPTLLSSQRFLLPSSARYLRPLLEVPRLATSFLSLNGSYNPATTATKLKRVFITVGQRQALRMPNTQRKQASLATWFEEQYGHRLSLTTTSESLSAEFKDGIAVSITGDILREMTKKFWTNLAVYQGKQLTSFNNEWLGNQGQTQHKTMHQTRRIWP